MIIFLTDVHILSASLSFESPLSFFTLHTDYLLISTYKSSITSWSMFYSTCQPHPTVNLPEVSSLLSLPQRKLGGKEKKEECLFGKHKQDLKMPKDRFPFHLRFV